MPLILRERNDRLTEKMDSPDCDPAILHRTYRRFRMLNRTLARWKWVFRNYLLPLMDEKRAWTLLDIGSGGCDVPALLSELARDSGMKLHITAIDPNPVAAGYVAGIRLPENVEYRQCLSSDLVKEAQSFDFVISNHMLHHLQPDEIRNLLQDTEKLCRQRAVHNDLLRSDAAWLLFALFAWPVTADTLNYTDGLRSIRRSYRPDELQPLAGPGWRTIPLFPYRTMLVYDA